MGEAQETSGACFQVPLSMNSHRGALSSPSNSVWQHVGSVANQKVHAVLVSRVLPVLLKTGLSLEYAGFEPPGPAELTLPCAVCNVLVYWLIAVDYLPQEKVVLRQKKHCLCPPAAHPEISPLLGTETQCIFAEVINERVKGTFE